MGFNIPNIEDAQFYIDLAFSKAKQTAQRKRTALREDRREKSRQIEHVKVQSVTNILADRLQTIVDNYPSFDQLNKFYTELSQLYFDVDDVRRALGNVQGVVREIRSLGTEYMERIEDADEIQSMNDARNEFYGRVASLVEDIDDALETLLEAKRHIIDFPVLKEQPTVCITGFPNVGKTTLLKELTGSEPPIESYGFTTKRLNFGYTSIDTTEVQFIDTPGTLAREGKMNDIERKSFVALRYADIILYVWDATEQYTLDLQQRLYDRVTEFDTPVVEYISKLDIADIGDLSDREACTSIEEVRDVIRQRLP